MKRLLPLLFLLLAVGCNKTENESLPHGTHYFHVVNQLDREVKLHFNVVSNNSEALPDSVQINRYSDVILPPGVSTLVRVFIGSENVEALNCFDYDKVLLPTQEPRCTIHDGENVSDDIWKGENWTYESISKWTSLYTMTITEDLL